jgi:protoporphyrinogen/coproporphyrinogen III oxidase
VSRHVSALVVGGGISGLVCAAALRKSGVDVQLVEASPRLGGAIRSASRDGYLVEQGPQSFSGTAALRELSAELGLSAEIVEAPHSAPRYVLVDGKLQAVPMSPPAFFTSKLIDGATKWALLRDIFGKSAPPDSDESVAAFVRRKFSPLLLERLVGPFISGVYAGDPEKLSIRATFPQLYEAEKVAGSIVRGMMRLSKAKKGPREKSTLQTFRPGNETLVRALAAKLGTAVVTGIAVKDISQQTGGSYDVRLESSAASEMISTKSIVFATPPDVAGKLLSQLDSAFEGLLTPVEYAAVAVVSLGYRTIDMGHGLEGFGFLVPRSTGLHILGTVWNSSLFPGRAPEGRALLTTFVGGATNPAAATMSAAELVAMVHREITPLLAVRKDPVFSNVTIWPRALPQYNLGHTERLTSVANHLARCNGIYLTGNYLRGPAIGTCVEQALAVASDVTAYLSN